MKVKKTISSVSFKCNENPFLKSEFQELIYQSYILDKFKEGKICKYIQDETGLYVNHIAINRKTEILRYSYFENKIAQISQSNKARLGNLENLSVSLETL